MINLGIFLFAAKHRGTSGIDIDLRRVDIDQCPQRTGNTQLNIFAASDKCKVRTTKVSAARDFALLFTLPRRAQGCTDRIGRGRIDAKPSQDDN